MSGYGYRSTRARAWRNLMVCAINAGLEQKLFSLTEDPAIETASASHAQPPKLWRFVFPGAIDGIAAAHGIGYGEISIHAALRPRDDAARWIVTNNAGFLAGDAFATGWLERRTGAYLQSSPGLFCCRAPFKPLIAAAEIAPLGYAEKGKVML
jgi:hypothetical protein